MVLTHQSDQSGAQLMYIDKNVVEPSGHVVEIAR